MNEAAREQLRSDFTRLRGRLFELVEACGFPSKQESAAKKVIRRSTYDMQRAIEGGLRDRRDD